jgi:phosphatidate cytidylyltransferase
MGFLRQLDVSQQVGLLFVALFGLLMFVTIASVSRSLRERTPEQQVAWEQYLRDLRAVWVSTVLFWIAWIAGAVVSTLLFALISCAATTAACCSPSSPCCRCST